MKMDDSIPEDLLQKLVKYCQIFFLGLKVEILNKEVDIPAHAEAMKLETRVRDDTNKKQFQATMILDILEKEFLPEDAYCLIGLLNQDLYP